MRILTLFITIFLSSIFIFPQQSNLIIKVINADKGDPIINANIALSEKYYGTTNNFGECVFNNLMNKNYSLTVSHVSYKKITKSVTVFSDTSVFIQLHPVVINLNDIVVTSGKYEQNIQFLPYSVSVVRQKEIKLNPSITVSDLLKNESGISLLRDGIWGTEISIRGLSRANVVTLIDGNRIETSTDLSARLSMFDLNDVERIEIIKGSASSLYGSGATGGIINVISKSGYYSSKFNLKGNYNSGYNSVNNFYSNGINLIASGNEWILKFSGIYRTADNTKTPSGELSNSQFKDNSFSALVQLKPFENQEIKFNYQQFNATDVGIPGAAPLFPNTAKVSYPEELRRLLSAEYKINNLSRSLVKLSAKYYHQFISRDVENIPGIVQYAPAGNGLPLRRISVLKISPGADHKVDGFQSQADFRFDDHFIIAGIDFWTRNYNGLRTREQKIEILNSSDSSLVRTTFKTTFEKPLPNADFSSAGIYLQDEINLFNKLNLTIGGRYDFIWLSNSETLNPSFETNDGVVNNNPTGQKIIWKAESTKNKSYVFNLGLIYSLSDNFNLSFNASRSFRSPSLEERYQYIDLGSIIRVGDPNLKPEQGYFFDLGFRLFPNDFNLTTSLFFNTLNELVTEIPGTYENRNALIKTNIGEAHLYGFEYSISINTLEQFSIYNTLSFVRGLNKKDDQDLPQISPLNGVIGLKYYPLNWLSADFSTVFFTEQNKVAPGEIKTPGYVTFNFQLNFVSLIYNDIQTAFSLGIENIIDKNYRNHLSTNRGFIISEPGRNIFIRANVEF